MTNGAACPDRLLLSQFLDHALEEQEAHRVAHHLIHCPDCRAQVGHWRHVDDVARAQVPLSQPPLLFSVSASCPPLEKVASYMQGLLPAKEDQQVEQHLQDCETCFREAKDAARIQIFLASLQEAPVSASLKAQVANQWEIAEKKASSVPRIVIQLAERGLQLISSYLAPPLLHVEEVFVSQPAYRRGTHSSALALRLQTGESEIHVLATPEDEGVTVRLTLLGPERQALSDHRIFIRQHGRAIFSAQTDAQGELHAPRLEPGNYEVACDEIHTTFQLELRP